MLKEWPLVAFTILSQTAVGLCLFLFLPIVLTAGTPWTDAARASVLLIILLILGPGVLAAAVSFFHLRHPFRARRVLANLGTSWLSREILFELAFLAFVALAFWLVRTGREGGALFKAALAAAMLAGVLFLLSMSKLYMLETLPAWSSARTLLSFAATALNLGALLTALVFLARSRPGPYSGVLLRMSAAIVFLRILMAFLFFRDRRAGRLRRGPSLRPPAPPSHRLRVGKVLLLSLGFIAIVAGLITGDFEASGGGDPLLPVALALIFVSAGEIAGRFLFYGLVPRPGD